MGIPKLRHSETCPQRCIRRGRRLLRSKKSPRQENVLPTAASDQPEPGPPRGETHLQLCAVCGKLPEEASPRRAGLSAWLSTYYWRLASLK